ncbi:MAG: ribbon-helix-helix domain-containing protein [Bdellovibrionales bacterium]
MTSTTGCNESPVPESPGIGRSTLVSRNVTIAGHRTSVRLEPEMWNGLMEICRRERATLHEICTSIAMRKHANTSLTAAIRVFAMAYFRIAATEDGHIKAGHGYNVTMGMTPPLQRPPAAHVSGPAFINRKMEGTRRY